MIQYMEREMSIWRESTAGQRSTVQTETAHSFTRARLGNVICSSGSNLHSLFLCAV